VFSGIHAPLGLKALIGFNSGVRLAADGLQAAEAVTCVTAGTTARLSGLMG
jgi:hypothetical protein